MDEAMAARVRAALISVSPRLVSQEEWFDGTHLFRELGITSLELVDAALQLESEFGLTEFPVQDWLDGQYALGAAGFSFGELTRACQRALEGGVP